MHKKSVEEKQNNNRSILISSLLFSLFVIALIITIYYRIVPKEYFFSENNTIIYPSEKYQYSLNNVELDNNGILTITNTDPQILYIFSEPKRIHSIKIELDEPVSERVLVEIYYGRTDEGLNQSRVRQDLIFPGRMDQCFLIPENDYEIIRLDINGNVDIKNIYISPDQLHIKLPVVIFAVIFLFVFLFSFYTQKNNRHYWREIKTYFHIPDLTSMEKFSLVFCFCIYLFWTFTFTSWHYGPDEHMRYDVPKYIYENKELPIGTEESIRNQILGWGYAVDGMSIPYLTSAGFMWIMSLFTTEPKMLLIAARFSSVLSAVGTVYFAILIAKKLFGNEAARWIFVIFMSLLPQIVFLSSYLNLDIFSLFTVMMIIYSWIDCLEHNWNTPSIILLSFGLGFCFLSYKFAYSYILVTFFLFIFNMVVKRKNIRAFLTKGFIIFFIVFIICGWNFIRNAILFNGDFLSLHVRSDLQEIYAREDFKPSNYQTYQKTGISPIEMLKTTDWISSTYKSMIGGFGQMDIWMNNAIYDIYILIFGIGGIGALLRLIEIRKEKQHSQFMEVFIGMFIASLITIAISVYYSWSIDYEPQGRYVITITPFLFTLAAIGFTQWLHVIADNLLLINEKRYKLEKIIVILFFVFLLFSVFHGYVCCLREFVYPFQ